MDDFQPFNDNIRHKEIDLIQSTITRMSNFQLTVKGACLTMLAFLFTASISSPVVIKFTIGLIAIRACKNLDVNYLYTEKLYRAWFEFINLERPTNKAHLFELNPSKISQILDHQLLTEHKTKELRRSAKKSWSTKFYNSLYLIIAVICIYPYLTLFI